MVVLNYTHLPPFTACSWAVTLRIGLRAVWPRMKHGQNTDSEGTLKRRERSQAELGTNLGSGLGQKQARKWEKVGYKRSVDAGFPTFSRLGRRKWLISR